MGWPPSPPTWHDALASPSNSSSSPRAPTPQAVNPTPTMTPWLTAGPKMAITNNIELWAPAVSPQQESGSNQPQHPPLYLPPSHIVFPIIKRYFATCNQTLPIFHEPTFYTMVMEWYQDESPSSPARDPATWAVINAAMALALRQTSGGLHNPTRHEDDRMSRECTANAQSVLDLLVTRDEDFKGLQTLLCLSILFMTSPSPKPACVLIATAVKLVHRLRAHTKEGKDRLDSATALQRDRLFWVTFVLDRDLSMKSVEPYIQQDNEYDVDPPTPTIPDDGVGVLATLDGTQKINLFHYRVRLALIQGALHDTMHSVRARSMDPAKRRLASEKLGCALWEWRCSLPEIFRHEKLETWEGGVPRVLLQLHLTYMLCFFMSFRLHVRDAEWMEQLTAFSDQFAPGERNETGNTGGGTECMLPNHWGTFVEAARASIAMAKLIDEADSALIWCVPEVIFSFFCDTPDRPNMLLDADFCFRSSTCLFQAAITVLIANNLTVSQHHMDSNIDTDTEIIDEGLVTLGLRLSECNLLISKHATVTELNQRSKLAVEAYSAGMRAAESMAVPEPRPF